MISKKTKNKTELRIKKFGLQLPRIFFLHKAKTPFFFNHRLWPSPQKPSGGAWGRPQNGFLQTQRISIALTF